MLPHRIFVGKVISSKAKKPSTKYSDITQISTNQIHRFHRRGFTPLTPKETEAWRKELASAAQTQDAVGDAPDGTSGDGEGGEE